MKLVKSPSKRITRIYIIALLLVGLITVVSQFLVSYVLKNQSADSRVVNVAGRQRMLSQKLTKTALIVYQADNETDFAKQHQELQDIIKLWEKSHHALQFGDTSLQIPANHNSGIIKKMFALVEPHFLSIKNATVQVATYDFQTSKEQFKPNLNEIMKNEPHFLRIMNEITFQYDKEAVAKIEKLKTIEIALMCITLIILLLEAILVFRPAVKKIDFYFEQLQASNRELQQNNHQLSVSEEEIRQNMEELETNQEELKAKNEQLEDAFGRLNRQNQKVNDSIRYAQRIQNAILTHEYILASSFSEYFIIFEPKDVVSGDFYWYVEIENKKILAIVDCTGHGVPGAFMSMIGNTLLYEIINTKRIFEPHLILDELHLGVLNALNKKDAKIQDGMDLALCCIEKQMDNKVKVQFSGAKRPLYYFSNNQLKEIQADRKSIGQSLSSQTTYTLNEITLQEGDTLYMSTDGWIDSINPERKRFGSQQFKEMLLQGANLSLKVQEEVFRHILEDYEQGTEQRDDVLLVGVRV